MYHYSATKCPACGHDWQQENGVTIELAVAGQTVEVPSRLDEDGDLLDTDDNAVASGLHSATLCGGCDENLCVLVDEASDDVWD